MITRKPQGKPGYFAMFNSGDDTPSNNEYSCPFSAIGTWSATRANRLCPPMFRVRCDLARLFCDVNNNTVDDAQVSFKRDNSEIFAIVIDQATGEFNDLTSILDLDTDEELNWQYNSGDNTAGFTFVGMRGVAN